MANNYRISMANCCRGPGSLEGAWSGLVSGAGLSGDRECHGGVGTAAFCRALSPRATHCLTSAHKCPHSAPSTLLSIESHQSHALFL